MNIFVDSSVLIEYIKGNRLDLYEALIEQEHNLFTNQVGVSEYLFHFIAVSAQKSPLSVKESGKIAEVFGKRNPFDMMPDIKHLDHNQEIAFKAFEIMKQYNMLPNDAIIVATCDFFKIDNLATFDEDFDAPCKDFGIRIIKDTENLFEIIPRINLKPET